MPGEEKKATSQSKTADEVHAQLTQLACASTSSAGLLHALLQGCAPAQDLEEPPPLVRSDFTQ